MSQILDALRRAEAQRSRGRVPGLHEAAGQVILQPTQVSVATANRPLLIAAAVLLTAMLIGLLLLVGRGADSVPPPAVPNASPAIAAAPTSGIGAADVPAAPFEQPRVPALPESQTVVGLPRKAQVLENPVEPAGELATRASAGKPLPASAPAARSVAGAAAPTGASLPTVQAQADLPARQDLPAEIQRGLPPITISGSVYASDPAQRMLVVNGEIWREGDEIRPGLVLEQIRRRDAVLRYNGVRFSVGP